MTWTEPGKRCWNDSKFKKVVIEGVQNRNAGGGNFQPARVLNSSELKKALGTTSVPRIKVPHTPEPGEDISIDTKDRRHELFALQDPNSSCRVAELVTMYGWEHKVEHMPTQLWKKQGEAMVHAKFMKQMKDTNSKVLHAGECPLTSFDDFVAKHGKQRSVRAKTHCATQGLRNRRVLLDHARALPARMVTTTLRRWTKSRRTVHGTLTAAARLPVTTNAATTRSLSLLHKEAWLKRPQHRSRTRNRLYRRIRDLLRCRFHLPRPRSMLLREWSDDEGDLGLRL